MFPGFSRWNYAFAESTPQHAHSSTAAVHTAYHPLFFSPDEYRTIEILADLILPATHSAPTSRRKLAVVKAQPGAKEAGVAEFIDFSVANDPALQAPFRSGLQWLDQASAPATRFSSLVPTEQNAMLERLAYKANYRAEEKSGQAFFLLVRKYTVTGFYTSRIGLESLDYPGLTFYATSPGCTHEGNPQHAGL